MPLTAEDVTRIRELLEMNQAEFAKHLNVPPSTVNRWERGHRSVSPAYEKLLQMEERRASKGRKK